MDTSAIGFIGLGNMGKGMSLNFARKGYPLIVFDINQNAMKTVVEQGPATPARNPEEVARMTDVIILSLPSPVPAPARALRLSTLRKPYGMQWGTSARHPQRTRTPIFQRARFK